VYPTEQSRCGEGFHAAFLSKAGYQVTGLDANTFMLSRAKENFTRLNCTVTLRQREMAEWQEKNSYDAIVSFGHSFGVFENPEEGKNILRNIYVSLKPGGKFFIEVYGKEMFDRVYPKVLIKEKDGTTLVRLCKVLNGYEKFESYFYFLRDEKAEIFKVESFLYSAQELTDLLRQEGFKIIGVYGNYDQAPYDHNSESLMILAEKPNES
jgi:SAM-dependent methyltransferase